MATVTYLGGPYSGRTDDLDTPPASLTVPGGGTYVYDAGSSSYAYMLGDPGRGDLARLEVGPLSLLQAAALGLAPGYAYIEKVGFNPDVDAASAPEDVWNGGGLYTGFPSVSETLELFSSSAADTAAGTGARTVRLVGLDADGRAQFENVTLNGTTPVVTLNTWSRVNRAYVLGAGSGGANVGGITIRHSSTTANVFAVLPPGRNQTQVANYTIPAGFRGLVTHLRVAVSNQQSTAQEAEVQLLVRESGGVFRVRRPLIVSTLAAGDDVMAGGIRCEAGADIVVRVADATADNLTVVSRMEITLVDLTAD
jgi:hypothetical protein